MFPVLKLIPLGITVCATAGIAWLLHNWDVNRIEDKHRAEVSRITLQLKAECEEARKKTERLNDDQEKRISDLTARYDSATKRVRSYKECVPIAASSSKPATSGQGFPWANGVPAEYLIDKSRNADLNTEKLITCNKALDMIYNPKGE